MRGPTRSPLRGPWIAAIALLSACAAPVESRPVTLSLFASSAASPWLESAYDCSIGMDAFVLTADPGADLVIQLGEPEVLEGPAFQIGSDDLLVVVHPQVGVGSLTVRQVEALFTGEIHNWSDLGGADQAVQVWSLAPGIDIQDYFARTVLNDRPVSSLSRLAVSSQHMSDSVGKTSGSIGILPRRWKAGNTNEVLIVGTLPVLAIPKDEPTGHIARLIACMQATH